jgi:hypothetical protein
MASVNGGFKPEDVADIKKALATGASTQMSARKFVHVKYNSAADSPVSVSYPAGSVPPILCYCIASILMTVVNKVCDITTVSPISLTGG